MPLLQSIPVVAREGDTLTTTLFYSPTHFVLISNNSIVYKMTWSEGTCSAVWSSDQQWVKFSSSLDDASDYYKTTSK